MIYYIICGYRKRCSVLFSYFLFFSKMLVLKLLQYVIIVILLRWGWIVTQTTMPVNNKSMITATHYFIKCFLQFSIFYFSFFFSFRFEANVVICASFMCALLVLWPILISSLKLCLAYRVIWEITLKGISHGGKMEIIKLQLSRFQQLYIWMHFQNQKLFTTEQI